MSKKLFRISEFAEAVGKSPQTIRRWEAQGKITPKRTESYQRLFTQDDVDKVLGIQKKDPKTVVYLRVSSHSQKDDLVSQRSSLEQWALASGTVVDEYITDIGSGLNFKRKNLAKLVNQAITEHQPINVIVAHKDRLARFGTELYEDIFTMTGGSVTIVNVESLSPTEELVQDILAILHVFSSRLYGLRRYEKAIKDQDKRGDLE